MTVTLNPAEMDGPLTLVTVSDIAETNGVHRQTVYVWTRQDLFPASMATFGMTSVWNEAEVVLWLEHHRGLQPCGTNAAYVRHRLNGETPCDACRSATAAHQASSNADRHRRMVAGESHPQHGAASTYFNWLCRCDECKDAGKVANRKQYERRTAA